MSGSEDGHTTHLTEPQNQTVKDKAISMTEDDSSLSPSDSLRRRRDVEDVDDEITHFAANTPWKCHVGRKRKVFWLFYDQVAEKSKLLLSMMNESNVNELYLEGLQPNHFDTFVHWVYHDRLPDKVLASSMDANGKMIKLWSLACALGAPVLQNRLMDMYYELSGPADELMPKLEDLVALYKLGLQNTELGVMLLTTFVWYTVQSLENGLGKDFAGGVPFDKEHAEVYFQVMQMTGGYLRNRKRIDQMLKKSYHWHVHAEDEPSCYSDKCVKYRERAKTPDKGDSREATYDSYRELTPVSQLWSSP
ncbi:hypothetical protein PMZ80_005459 [Knufia obscura]|uniref:Uncharacterized protein n=1 Tax=Knufia obscura TaxID=1635080 RepID=A0ABR0RRK7_9EURO|nr:hypothetical protein PMZ80_005459 [Knufia obscura]